MQMYCQGCSLCEQPFCGKQCNSCFSLCPKRPAAFAYLKKIGGGKIILQGNRIAKLPVFIPVIPDHRPIQTNLGEVIGVHGGNLLTSNGENVARVYRQKGLQDALSLSEPVQGVLQFYVKDRAIEGLWDNRKEIYKQLAEFPWEAIVAPNFSVYEDVPRIDHLYNMKRSNVVFNELLEVGLPAVSDISWYNRIDLDQWIRAITTSGIKTIAFSFQTVSTSSKPGNIWKHYLMGYHYLMQNLSADVAVIVAGLASPKRLEVLQTAGNGENRKKMWTLPIGELFMIERATATKLKKININTIGNLAKADLLHMKALLKSHGEMVWNYANGNDDSLVIPNAEIQQKGVGNSTTIAYDVTDKKEAQEVLLALCERVGMRLRKLKRKATLITLSIKTNSFIRYSHQMQYEQGLGKDQLSEELL